MFVLTVSLVLPGAASAQSNTPKDMSQDNYLINPWTKLKVYYNEESPSQRSLSAQPTGEIFNGEEAVLILNKLKTSMADATNQSNSQDTNQKYEQLLSQHNTSALNNSNQLQPFAQTKAWYRTEFTALAYTFGVFSCPTAGNFLLHSLQDNPSDRNYEAGSSLSNGLSLTTSYTEISIPMAAAIDQAHAKGDTYVGGSGSHYTSAGNAGLDWYLTLGKYKYLWAAEKQSNGKWTVYININDKYDYDTIDPLPSSFPASAIALVSNHAADAQDAGAIVPYWSHFYMKQTNYTP